MGKGLPRSLVAGVEVNAGPETRFVGPSQPIPNHTHISQGLCAHFDLSSETWSMPFQRHLHLSTPCPPADQSGHLPSMSLSSSQKEVS